MSILLSLYRGLTALSGPPLKAYLRRRQERGKEHASRFPERFGQASLPRPGGKVLWLHGASNGELISAFPLLNAVLAAKPDWHALVTSGTVTSAATFDRHLHTLPPGRVSHQFVPVDHPQWVKRFMDHWRPDGVVWLESELWPNLLHTIQQRRIPAALVNARMRPRTVKRWRMMPGTAQNLLRTFKTVLVMSGEFVAVFKELGARHAVALGNLKFANAPPAADADKLAALQAMIGDRLCIGAFSTHATDEVLFARTVRQLKNTFPGMLGIIAPHHATRLPAILADLQGMDFKIAVRSRHDPITPETDLYIADTRGEMGLWHHVCACGVIGGSFFPFGGQNTFECTHRGCVPVYGPYMFNFTDMVKLLEEHGVSVPVADSAQLYPALLNLLQHPATLLAKQQAARAMADDCTHVITPIAEAIVTSVMI